LGLEVSRQEIDESIGRVDSKLITILQNAASNIMKFHEKEVENSWFTTRADGSFFGIKVSPIERVGVYVPGGSAILPSSVLMNVIPAKVAGVSEIVMCTPPGADGKISPLILAAAKIAGADRVFRVGGAQAIGAMAYGTKFVPKVDKITGPGNIYVATAKSKIFGYCGIDMIAGPSEILIIADSSANAKYVVADMLSQAEHDPMAASILISTDKSLIDDVILQLEFAANLLSRKDIARKSLINNGAAILVKDIAQAIELSNLIAPEHLELCVEQAVNVMATVKNAGAIFCGNWSPEPMGDYYCGSNHVLPTGGTARFSSPLGVWDFVKKSSVIFYSKEGFLKDANEAALFAMAEGLDAHACSINERL